MSYSSPTYKGNIRQGSVEGVNVKDPILVKLLPFFTIQRQPRDFILDFTPADYRTVFAAAAAQAIGLPSTIKPYSLRRGGATWHFRVHGSISLTMEIGRWKNQQTARTYVNTALMELTEMSFLSTPVVAEAC